MKKYQISFKYSTNGGRSWTGRVETVSAESDLSAIRQIESKFDMVKDIRIISVR